MSVATVRRDLVRSAEWHRVRDFAQQVRASPAALAIQGEAGAGKSTLWRAGIEAGAASGYRLLRSEPSASETDLSFAGLSDLLAGFSPLAEGDIPGPQLIAAGATNRDAATALFVSVRTVETHVASIYRKLGVRTRSELARRRPRPQLPDHCLAPA
jgi:hypothetical protein